MTMRRQVEVRFWENVAVTGDCWWWTGTIVPDGYGNFRVEGKTVGAHRWSYKYLVGPVPKGLELDHLCRNPACVNPDHLEAVNHRENCLRGEGVSAINARKTECLRGHPFSGANLVIEKSGQRYCRKCKNEQTRRHKRLKREQARQAH